VLLDDVQLLLDNLLGDVEGTAAAVRARGGPQRVGFDLEMRGQRLATDGRRGFGAGLTFGQRGRRGRRRTRARCASRTGGGEGRRRGRRLGAGALGDASSSATRSFSRATWRSGRVGRDELIELRRAAARALLRVLAPQLGDGGHAVTRSHRRALSIPAVVVARAAIPAAPRGGEVDAREQRRERRAVDLDLRRPRR
jgi:hypothetical protein